MRRYHSIQALWLSFFSTDLYRDVARQWRGVGLLYLLLVCALCTIPWMVKLHAQLSHFTAETGTALVEQLPNIAIRDGHASVDVATPYIIRDPRTHAELAIIDTSGKITTLEGQTARVLLTETSLWVKKSEAETRTFDLSRVKNLDLPKSKLRHGLVRFTAWFVPFLTPFAIVFAFIVRTCQVLFYALFALLFARMHRVPMNYTEAMRITAVASTPMMIIDAALWVAGVHVPLWWALCQVLVVAYVVMGVKAYATSDAGGDAAPVSTETL